MLRFFLWPFAKGFELISRTYQMAWDRGIFQSQRAPIPIVCIGNLVVGGVGKTPVTILLANTLSQRKTRCAIASRGYLSKWENSSNAHLVDPLRTKASECGDEPLLMARKCPNVSVWITKRRMKSAQCAAHEGAEVLLLDDGMQYRNIEKDFEIVLLDATLPFGNGSFFPLGTLRDHPQRLSAANLIILMNCKNEATYQNTKTLVGNYTKAPITGFKSQISLPQFKKIAVLTAFANQNRFLDLLRVAGIEIVFVLTLRDHTLFKNKMIEAFTGKAIKAGAEAIICTEKDHVKIESPLKSSIPIVPIPLEIVPVYDKERWEQALDQIIRLPRESVCNRSK